MTLMFAARCGHLEIVRELVKNGANVDLVNESGWSVLILAAYYGHVGVVKYLVESGASVDLVNDE